MLKDEINRALTREPFVPLRLHLRNGKKVNVPFRGMSHVLGYGVLIFKGMKEGTRAAKGYDTFIFDDILRIEELPPAKAGHRRRKAS